MSASGTNRLVQSESVLKGASQSALGKNLLNANEVAKSKDLKKKKK